MRNEEKECPFCKKLKCTNNPKQLYAHLFNSVSL